MTAASQDTLYSRLPQTPWRWWLVSFFLISSALNYLDRLLLASLAPVLKTQFHLTDFDYGNLLAIFAITYALGAPVMGYLMDRYGLTRIMALAVGIWSMASIATGVAQGLGALIWCRVILGIGESGGVPGTGKAYGTYLLPKERALGAGVGQLAISAGQMMAPLLAAWALARGSWQLAFVVAGASGFAWIILWAGLVRISPQPQVAAYQTRAPQRLLKDKRLWLLMAANFLWMAAYTLWTNWTTNFLVFQYHLTTTAANQNYAWIPPLGGTAGALLGGSLSYVWIARGVEEVAARKRVCLITALLALCTFLTAFAATPGIAVLCMSASYFFIAAGSTNLYTIPVDLYGSARSGFAMSCLVMAYGVTSFVFNPLIGKIIDNTGSYKSAFGLIACLPLVAFLFLLPVSSSTDKREMQPPGQPAQL